MMLSHARQTPKQPSHSVERLRELFYVDQDGVLRHRQNRLVKKKRIYADNPAGSFSGRYMVVEVDGARYQVHHISFALWHGRWPITQIDHIDGNPLNNSPINLREVSSRGNQQNRISHRNGRLPGAHWERGMSKWRGRIRINNKLLSLGCFDSELEAHNAYKKALENLEKPND